MKAKAILFPEPRQAAVETVEIPPPGERDVLVEVEYSAISAGTERWCLTDRMYIAGRPPLAFPHVPGYQAAGVVREAGRLVRGLAPGDRVFSRNCRAPAGWPGSWWGGHVGWHVAEEDSVLKLPEEVSTREASGLLLAQVGYNGAHRPALCPGDAAAVIGEGLVGQYAAQVLRHRGAHVIVSGLAERRLELARRYSADEVFDSSRGDFAAFIHGRWPQGVAVVVETASLRKTIRQAIELLGRGGQLVLNGYYPPPDSTLDWHWLRDKELTVHFPNSRTRERLERTLELIARGAIRVEELITHDFPLSRAAEAYARLLAPEADFLGMVIRWR